MEFLLALAILVAVGFFVSIPLRRASGDDVDPKEADLADLEARKEIAYRTIRDAEADHAAGKLTEADFKRLDREARREAIDDPGADRPPAWPRRRVRARTSLDFTPMETLLSVVNVAISVILIFLVLLHSGKDSGLSGMGGIGGGGGSFGGGSLVERNLTRWTIFFGVLWALNAVILLRL